MEETWKIFPVITLYQPWATWVMRGWKDIETRTHGRFISLVGREVLIHAGMKTDGSDYALKNPYLTKEQILFEPDEMINGHILGKVKVGRFQLLNDSHSKRALINCHDTKRYGLFLSEVEKFETTIPEKGEMGIWYYDLANRRKATKNQEQIQTLF